MEIRNSVPNSTSNKSLEQLKDNIIDIIKKNLFNEDEKLDKIAKQATFMAQIMSDNIFDTIQKDDKTLKLENDYDNLDKKIDEINFLNDTVINNDNNDNNTTQEDIAVYYDNGNVQYERTYTYDHWGQLKEENYTGYNEDGTKDVARKKLYENDEVIYSSEYQYGDNNEAKSAAKFECDEKGNLIYQDQIYFNDEGEIETKSRTYYGDDNIKENKSITKYDSKGNRTETEYSYDETEKITKQTVVEYDKDNKITSKEMQEENSISYSHNKTIENTKQGRIGDCWLLSSVTALSYSEAGKEIIKNALCYTPDATIVNLGNSVSYKIDNEELLERKTRKDRSQGDDDMIAFEIAIEKFRKDINNGELTYSENYVKNYNRGHFDDTTVSLKDNIEGGINGSAVMIITGNIPEYTTFHSEMDKMFKKYEESESKNFCMTADATKSSKVKDINGQEVKIAGSHAYSIKSVDKDSVTVVNPWNTEQEICLSKKTFKKAFYSMTFTDLEQTNKDSFVIKTNSEVSKNMLGKETKIIKDLKGNKIKTVKYDVIKDKYREVRLDTSGDLIYKKNVKEYKR